MTVDGKKKPDINEPADLYQHSLETAISIPVREDGQFRRLNLAVDLADEREIDSGYELDNRRLIGVVLSADNLQAVDAVLVHGLQVT